MNDKIKGDVTILCQSCGEPFLEIFSHPPHQESLSFYFRSAMEIPLQDRQIGGTCPKCGKPWYIKSNDPKDIVEPSGNIELIP